MSSELFVRDATGPAKYRVNCQGKIVQIVLEEQRGRDDWEMDWLSSVEGGDLPWSV